MKQAKLELNFKSSLFYLHCSRNVFPYWEYKRKTNHVPFLRGDNVHKKANKREICFSTTIILLNDSLNWLWIFWDLTIHSNGEIQSASPKTYTFYRILSSVQEPYLVWYLSTTSRHLTGFFISSSIANIVKYFQQIISVPEEFYYLLVCALIINVD